MAVPANLEFAADPRFIWCTTGSGAYPLQLLDIKTGRPQTTLLANLTGLGPFKVDAQRNRLVAAVQNKDNAGLAIWDTTGVVPVAVVPLPGMPAAIALHPKDSLAAVLQTGKESTVAFVNLDTGEVTRTLSVGSFISQIFFSPDGSKLAVLGVGNSVWDSVSGEVLYKLPGRGVDPRNPKKDRPGDFNPLSFYEFDRDNRLIAMGLRGEFIRKPGQPAKVPVCLVRYTDNGTDIEVLEPEPADWMNQRPQGDFIALPKPKPDGSSEYEIWHWKTRKLLRTIDGSGKFPGKIAYSPAGDKVAVIGRTGVIRIWDLPASSSPAASVPEQK